MTDRRTAQPSTNVVRADGLWLDSVYLLAIAVLLVGSTCGLAVVRTWYLLIPLLLCQALLFVGLMEAFHQAVHRNLHAHRAINNALGRLLGAHLGFSFTCYRRFHNQHHARANHSDDPEKLLYQREISVMEQCLAPGWHLFKSTMIVNRGDFLQASDTRIASYERASVVVFKVGALVLTLAFPMPMIFAYWLPFIIFTYIESIVSQSQHYFWPQTPVDHRVDHAASLNLTLPSPISFLLLNTNYHATHHVAPRTKWYAMPHARPSVSGAAKALATMDFWTFARSWIRVPRRWASGDVQTADADRAIR